MILRTLLLTAAIAAMPVGLHVRAQVDENPTIAPEAVAGDVGRGRAIYLRNSCQACHGSVGQGGGPGPILAATPLPYQAFVMQMREPSASMPAYDEALLSEQDLADIHAWLAVLPGPMETLPDILRD